MTAPSPNIQSVWFLDGNRPEKEHPRKRHKKEVFSVHMSDDELRQGNFAWLPIEGTDFRIVFNESEESMSRFLKNYDFGLLLWAFPEDDPHDIDYLPIPQEALVHVYEKFNEIINHIKETHPKYASEHDRFLSELLTRHKTEKHYYLYRTFLYGGLFDKQICN